MKTLACLCVATGLATLTLAATITTLIKTGVSGFSENQAGNPYGVIVGDGDLASNAGVRARHRHLAQSLHLRMDGEALASGLAG